jgi:hypothetical protein
MSKPSDTDGSLRPDTHPATLPVERPAQPGERYETGCPGHKGIPGNIA